jgi:hypothetical protein
VQFSRRKLVGDIKPENLTRVEDTKLETSVARLAVMIPKREKPHPSGTECGPHIPVQELSYLYCAL